MTHVTIATSSGAIWLVLVTHFGAGLVAIVAGTIALVVAKGGRLHKLTGQTFTWAMVVAGVLASVIAYTEGKIGMVFGGAMILYFVLTSLTTVKPLGDGQRRFDVIMLILAVVFVVSNYFGGVEIWKLPGHARNGVPAGMLFFLGTVMLLAALGDARMLYEGGIRGPRRIARHLWRMCFAFFIATGSFFLGQMKFIPAPIRIVPLLLLLGVAPLLVLIYWMWRVRLRKRLAGMIVSRPADATA